MITPWWWAGLAVAAVGAAALELAARALKTEAAALRQATRRTHEVRGELPDRCRS